MKYIDRPASDGIHGTPARGVPALLCALCCTVCSAQTPSWPAAPIRIIVPFAAGSASDTVARLVGIPMAGALGTQVLIDARPGANGNIGAELAARAPADGYTMLLSNSSHTISAALYDRLGYDFARDFAGVTQVGSGAYFLVTHPSLPVKSLKELVDYARARPAQINIGSGGAGGLLWVELLNMVTGIKLVNIAYKSTPQVAGAVLSGEVPVATMTTVQSFQQLRAGKLRGLAVSSPKRSVIAPEVPTVAEAGYPKLESVTWYGLLVPSATPAEIVGRLHAEAVRALAIPDVRQRFDALDVRIVGTTPAEFNAFLKVDLVRWRELAGRLTVKPE